MLFAILKIMAKRILIANWKNYPDSIGRVGEILDGLTKNSGVFKKVSTFIAPPLAYFESVSKRTKSFAHLASQDIFVEKGTTTGAVGMDILKSFGVRLSIIGHSERRALGETDGVVAEKIKIALKENIIPLVCIGESERDKEGEYLEFIRQELRLSLSGVKKKDDAKKLVVAYEPIWAIGMKARGTIVPEDLAQMVIFIRKVLTDLYDRKTADKISILYGGSVDHNNVNALVRTRVNGFLVGRASLDPKKFVEIAKSLIKR
jgi:triosephosphate isomerase